MNKLIYTSYSPNTRPKDLYIALRRLLTFWALTKGSFAKKITGVFEQCFPGSTAFTFNYARSGMCVLFKALKPQPGDEVIIQGFTCVAAVNPIIWAGARPVFVDIDSKSGNISLTDLRAKINTHTKAIVFQHTLGNSTGIEEVAAICKKHEIILVEDCTNTLSRPLGSFGDAAVFSFGRDKAISGTDGGLILVNSKDFIAEFESIYTQLTYPSWRWTFKELIYPIIWFWIKKTWRIKLGKLTHFVATALGLISLATTPEEKMGKMPQNIPALMPDVLAELAYAQLNDIDYLNKHRVMLNSLYATTLATVPTLKAQPGNILLRYPLAVNDRANLVAYLKKRNILVGDWYDTPIAPRGTNAQAVGYETGMCPESEQLCTKIINLPNHINITPQDAQTIVDTIKEFYDR